MPQHQSYGITDHIREDVALHPISPLRLLLGLIAFALALLAVVVIVGGGLTFGPVPS